MKQIVISTAAFAAIWAHRSEGEESEDAILRRILGLKSEAPPQAMLTGGKKMRWVDDIVDALHQLGGEAHYEAIYAKVRAIRTAAGRSVPRSFEEVVRKEIETHSTASDAYVGREDLFRAPKGKGNGYWALRT